MTRMDIYKIEMDFIHNGSPTFLHKESLNERRINSQHFFSVKFNLVISDKEKHSKDYQLFTNFTIRCIENVFL